MYIHKNTGKGKNLLTSSKRKKKEKRHCYRNRRLNNKAVSVTTEVRDIIHAAHSV